VCGPVLLAAILFGAYPAHPNKYHLEFLAGMCGTFRTRSKRART
jgi:hypothetical protein